MLSASAANAHAYTAWVPFPSNLMLTLRLLLTVRGTMVHSDNDHYQAPMCCLGQLALASRERLHAAERGLCSAIVPWYSV